MSLSSTYVATYIFLTRRGVREMSQSNVEGFLYDSLPRVLETEDFSKHSFRVKFFAPLNYLDRKYFGGEGPIRCFLFELS